MKSLKTTLCILFSVFCLCLLAPVGNAKPGDPTEKSASRGNKKPTKKTPEKQPESEASKLERVQRLHDALIELRSAAQAEAFVSASIHCDAVMKNVLPEDEFFYDISMMCVYIHSKAREDKKTIDLIDHIIKVKPELKYEFPLCSSKGMSLIRLHKYETAINFLNTCRPPEEELGKHIGSIAEIYLMLEDPQKAVEEYERSLEIDPRNEFAWFGIMVALMRVGREEDARQAFLKGINIDPKLSFYERSFFEPEGETLYIRALLMMFSHRKQAAINDLEAYLKLERRPAYRKNAEDLLEDLRDPTMTDGRIASYPVLLNDVSAVAIDARARYLAFADSQTGTVWLLDTETGSLTRRIMNESSIKSMAFDAETGVLRILSANYRYVLSPDADGYYVYENSPKVVSWMSLTTDSREIVGKKGMNQLVKAPFLDPDHYENIIKVPSETRYVSLSEDRGSAFLVGNTQNILWDLRKDQILGTPTASRSVLSVATYGNRFAVSLSHGVYIFDTENNPVSRIEPHPNEAIQALSFDPTGRYLLTLNGTVAEIWDTNAM